MDTVLKTKVTDLLMQEAHYSTDSKYRLTITLFLQKNSTIDIWEGPKYNLESIKTQVQIFCKKVQNLLWDAAKYFNPFLAIVPVLYHLKIPENQRQEHWLEMG